MRRALPLFAGCLLLASCTDTGCDDVLEPLDGPIPSSEFFADGAAVRISPNGVDFLEDNLSRIVGNLAASDCAEVYCPEEGGVWASCDADNLCASVDPERAFVAARIPAANNDVSFPIDQFLLCRDDFNGSNGGDPEDNATFEDCNVYVRVDDVAVDPSIGGGDVGLTANITVWSSRIRSRIDYSVVGSQTCDIYLRDADDITQPVQKTVNTSLSFATDPTTDRLTVSVAPLDVALTDDDVHLCSPFNGILKGLVFGFVEDTINGQIQDFAKDAIAGLLTEGCEEEPCVTAGATCNDDDLCAFDNGDLVPRLLGFEGKLRLDALLGGFAGAASTVDFSMSADRAEGSGQALNVDLQAAADASTSTCVPYAPRPNPTIPPFAPANADDHVAFAASDLLLNRLLYETYRSGALCQSIDGNTVAQLQSGVLSSLLVPSLGDITKGSVPLTIDIRPTSLPEVEIGRNVIGEDPADPTQDILIEPLLNLAMRDLDLDVYAEIESALVRILTLRVDLLIDLSLAIGPDGALILVAGDAGNWVDQATVINSELLAEDPETVAESIPTLLGIALPFLTESLDQQFALPAFAGFTVDITEITGSQDFGTTSRGDPRFAHMGIYADLDYDPSQASTLQVHTLATLREVDVPSPTALQAGADVRVTIDVDTLPALDAAPSVFVRVDGGLWRPPSQRRTVVVTDPVLKVEGHHVIEVMAGRAGAPATLDRTPQRIDVVVDARDPVITQDADIAGRFWVRDTVSGAADLRVEVRLDGGAFNPVSLAPDGGFTVESDADLVDVRAFDGSGRMSLRRFGAVQGGRPQDVSGQVVGSDDATPPATDSDSAAAVASAGCDHMSTTSAAAPWGAALLWMGLAVGLRRRRRPVAPDRR